MSTLNSAVSASASALAAERMRIEVAVSNLANAESTRGPDGKPYRRRDVVLTSDSVAPFDEALGKAAATGVRVATIVEAHPSRGLLVLRADRVVCLVVLLAHGCHQTDI